jgi:hypothetical protein
MRKAIAGRLLLAGSFLALTIAGAVAQDATIPENELRTFSEWQHDLTPNETATVLDKIRSMWGPGPYSQAQITAALNQQTKADKVYHPVDNSRPSKKPFGAPSHDEAVQQLDFFEKTLPKSSLDKLLSYAAANGEKKTVPQLRDALYAHFGHQPWYKLTELSEVESNGLSPAKHAVEWPDDDPIRAEIERAGVRIKSPAEDFKGLKIRQDWRDVLYEEDSSVPESGKALKDLVGATVSYVRNNAKGSDTWSSIGTLLLPWEHDFPLTVGLTPSRLAIAPSFGINRVDTNGDPTGESDSVWFRLGVYGEWYLSPSPPAKLQIRLAGVYATNTGFDVAATGFEMDLEPRWQDPSFPLGYKKVLIQRDPNPGDPAGWSALDFQLRAWLHLEGGRAHDNVKTWDIAKGPFFRLGPTIQFQLNAPKMAFGRDASLTAVYSFIPAVKGTHEHESYLKLTAVYDLVKDDTHNRKISMNLQYEKGGLNFTKDDVDSVTVGLGILY